MFNKRSFKILTVLLILLAFVAVEFEAEARVYVRGYYRKDGTYVRPHYRTAPDSNPYNNYSYPGNYNPNTGKITPGDPYKYLDRYYNRSNTYKAPTYKIPTYKAPTFKYPSNTYRSTYKRPTTTYNRSSTYSKPTTYNRAKLIAQAKRALNGAIIVADDDKKTYLGKIGGKYESASIFYKYGQYGSDYASKSIFNNYGIYGSNYSIYSPFNEYTLSPPYIVKDGVILGRLTVNDTLKILGETVISPYVLMVIYGKEKR